MVSPIACGRRIVSLGAESWCHHPGEELQRVFAEGPTPLPGRYLCGCCGEVLFEAPEGAGTTLRTSRERLAAIEPKPGYAGSNMGSEMPDS